MGGKAKWVVAEGRRARTCPICWEERAAEDFEVNSRCRYCRPRSSRRPEGTPHATWLKAKVDAYLLTHPCTDCGITDTIVLQFDHLPGYVKIDTISHMVRGACVGRRMGEGRCRCDELLIDEISKCEVACANCHVRRTARRHAERRGEVLPPAPAQPAAPIRSAAGDGAASAPFDAAPAPLGDPLSWFQEQRAALKSHEYEPALGVDPRACGDQTYGSDKACDDWRGHAGPHGHGEGLGRTSWLRRPSDSSAQASPLADVVSMAEYRTRP